MYEIICCVVIHFSKITLSLPCDTHKWTKISLDHAHLTLGLDTHLCRVVITGKRLSSHLRALCHLVSACSFSYSHSTHPLIICTLENVFEKPNQVENWKVQANKRGQEQYSTIWQHCCWWCHLTNQLWDSVYATQCSVWCVFCSRPSWRLRPSLIGGVLRHLSFT